MTRPTAPPRKPRGAGRFPRAPAGARERAATLALAAVALGACAPESSRTGAPGGTDAQAAQERPFDPARDPWPEIRERRVRELLPGAMERAGVDAWLVVVRENANDPLALHVGGENAGGTAVLLFLRDGEGGVRSAAFSPVGEAVALRDVALHDTVVALERGADPWAAAAAELGRAAPRTIAVNASSRAAADGLSWTQRRRLEEALGPDLAPRLVSSEELVVEWLSVKLPEEVEILRRAAALTERLELEAYARVTPGRTRDVDVARDLERRMEELGVEDAWAPAQNPNVNSGPDRGHSHATDRVIRPGDVVQTDFGIKVWGVWCTDVQRFAYVLRPGETGPPPEVQRRWEDAREGGARAFRAMRPGARGWDVDRAQREWMEARGSLPVPWSTGHPVGYWAHDVGPSLGGAQRPGPPSGDARRELRPGQVFAFDGFSSWEWPEGPAGATKTISVEEMAVITPTAAEYLIPPQRELVLIR